MAKESAGKTLIRSRERMEKENPSLRESLERFVEDLKKYRETVGKRNAQASTVRRARFQAQ